MTHRWVGGVLLVNSTSTISNCKITLCQGKGAGLVSVFNTASTNKPYVINCQIIKNYDGNSAVGAVYLSGGVNKGVTTLINCLIAENRMTGTSPISPIGSIFMDGDCSFYNVTVVNNMPKECYLACQYYIYNSLIFGGISNTNLTYYNNTRQKTSLVEGSPISDLSIGTITVDQVFKNISTTLGASDYSLKTDGPALNVGTDSYYNNTTTSNNNTNFPTVATIDLVGNARFNGTIDLGAYESNYSTGIEIVKNCIKIFPNPVVDKLHLEGYTDNVSVIISDMAGRIIINKAIKENSVDVHNLSKGLYIINIVDENGIKTGKFSKK